MSADIIGARSHALHAAAHQEELDLIAALEWWRDERDPMSRAVARCHVLRCCRSYRRARDASREAFAEVVRAAAEKRFPQQIAAE